MINQLVKLNSIAALALILAGCASAGPKAEKGNEPLPAPAASYSEKVQSLTLDQVKAASCPSDQAYANLEWKKILPLANACVKARDWNRVEKMGSFLATHAYLTPWGAYYMSVAAEARKDYPRAEWMLELALKKDPNEGLFHYQLGRIHWQRQEDAEALKQLKVASELNPSLTEAHWVMGQIALQRQDNSAAENYLAKSLSSDPKHLPSLLSMATLKINTKDWAKAEDLLTQAVKLNPRGTKARLALAQVQAEHLKKTNDALQSYRQLKQLSGEKKLDEAVNMNLDEKIHALEKELAQSKANQASARQPTAERAKP